MTPNKTKCEALKKEKEGLQVQIEKIEAQIASQPPKAPVNAMYERINRLAARILEIDEELCYLDTPSCKQDSSQLEKGFDIISGGGGINIRPEAEAVVDQTNQLELKRKPIPKGTKYAAPDPASLESAPINQ